MNGLEALEEIKGYKEVATLAGYIKQPVKKAYKKEFAVIKKELKAFEIIKKHAKENKHFKYLLYMAKYWEENKVEVTEELLYNYDFPYSIDEFDLLKEVMK